MRFYTTPHRYYCGIDLHARRMYICVLDCVLDAAGKILVHRNGPATPEHLLATIAPYREDVPRGHRASNEGPIWGPAMVR